MESIRFKENDHGKPSFWFTNTGAFPAKVFQGTSRFIRCRDVTTLAVGSHKEPIGKSVNAHIQNSPHGMDAVQ